METAFSFQITPLDRSLLPQIQGILAKRGQAQRRGAPVPEETKPPAPDHTGPFELGHGPVPASARPHVP